MLLGLAASSTDAPAQQCTREAPLLCGFGLFFPLEDPGQVSMAPCSGTLGQGCGVGSFWFHVGSQQEELSCGCQLDSGAQLRALAGPAEGEL